LIAALEQQKIALVEEAQNRAMENEKSSALLSDGLWLAEKLKEQKLKSVTT
jgi:hypothetical protein